MKNLNHLLSYLTLQKNSRLYQVSVGQCLAVLDPLSHKGYVAMAICDGSKGQQWQLEGWWRFALNTHTLAPCSRWGEPTVQKLAEKLTNKHAAQQADGGSFSEVHLSLCIRRRKFFFFYL